MKEDIVDELNVRGIDSNQFYTQRLENMISNLSETVVTKMNRQREETRRELNHLEEAMINNEPYDFDDDVIYDDNNEDEQAAVTLDFRASPTGMTNHRHTREETDTERRRKKQKNCSPCYRW